MLAYFLVNKFTSSTSCYNSLSLVPPDYKLQARSILHIDLKMMMFFNINFLLTAKLTGSYNTGRSHHKNKLLNRTKIIKSQIVECLRTLVSELKIRVIYLQLKLLNVMILKCYKPVKRQPYDKGSRCRGNDRWHPRPTAVEH